MSSESKRYLVKFVNVSDTAVIESVGGIVRHDYANMPELLSAELTEEQANLLAQNPAIKAIVPVNTARGASQYEDWGYIRTKVDSYYRQIYTGKNVKIGMVDSGVETHEDLNAVEGWVDYINSQSSQYDDLGHGTFGAGIIAGRDNTTGCVGVAPDAQIYAAKVLDSDNYGLSDDIVAGIDWCISQGVHIINLPISIADNEINTDVVDACRAAYSAGIIVVSCSGNGVYSSETKTWSNVGISTVQCPASDYSCIAVGATTTGNTRASFSDYGDGLDVVAPGQYVRSCDSASYSGYRIASGTSYATAYVTGHLACLKEKYPSYSRSQLVNNLLNNCLNLGDSYQYGYGLVQADPLGSFLENEPSVTSRIDAGFNLDWSYIPYADYYYLYYKKASDALWTRKTASISQYTAENLVYGYAYSFYVEAHRKYLNNGSTYSILIATSNTQVATVNPKPPTLSLISKTSNSITVQVDLASGIAEGDVVYISPSGDQSSIETSPGGQVTFTGLLSNTQYSLYAKSWILGADGVTILYSLTNGATVNITTNALSPETPSSAPAITSRGEGSISLSWGTSTYATSYTLRYKHYDGVYHTIPNISGTTYTLSGLEYGITYFLSVKGDNVSGSSEYTPANDLDNPGTTLAKSPGNLTNPATTYDTIDIRVADGMTGNWDYIRVYAYNNGITPSYKDISYASYQSGTRIVTWTNLSAGLTYKFNARTYYTYNSVALDSAYWSNDLYVATSSRPSNFYWTTPKNSGDPATNLTDDEWNALCAKINDFREYKSYTDSSFTAAITGSTFYASQFNQARNAILPMNGTGLPVTKVGVSDVVNPSDADDVRASDLNALVSCLNDIS